MLKPTVLVIFDGFGNAPKGPYNAISLAKTPCLTQLMSRYSHIFLKASGKSVGLPVDFQGNSEVGHLTIGAGRVLSQPLTVWFDAIKDGSFATHKSLIAAFNYLKKNGNTLHIIGLLSDAGIHGHEDLLYSVIDAATKADIKKIVVHAILDGRDTPPQSAYGYIKKLQQHLKHAHHAVLGSLQGRFYAMDRDNNWERTEKSYRVLTELQQKYEPWEKVLEKNYAHNITDEFIEPTQLSSDAVIKNGDVIFFCNIRPDRARQLTASFVQPHFTHFIVKPIHIPFFITPVAYGDSLQTTVLFPRHTIKNTLKDVLAQQGKTIFSVAETEKYAHITYFFRGENEVPVSTETCVLIPSIKTRSYADYPEMSASAITQAVLTSLDKNPSDFYLINYANADMVGHSGDLSATIKAVECLDKCLQQLYDTIVVMMSGTLIITSDHGKAEEMFDEQTQQPRTAHTTNSVPFVFVNKEYENSQKQLPLSELSDIAPFILEFMGLPVPREMKK